MSHLPSTGPVGKLRDSDNSLISSLLNAGVFSFRSIQLIAKSRELYRKDLDTSMALEILELDKSTSQAVAISHSLTLF